MLKLQLTKKKLIVIGIVLLVVALLVVINVVVFRLLALLLTCIGASLIYLVGFYYLVYYGCKVAVFPGSIWVWRRGIENHYCRQMASQVLKQLSDLGQSVKAFTEFVIDTNQIGLLHQSCGNAKGMMQSLLHTFNRQKQTNTLTRCQNKFFTLMLELQSHMLSTHIIYDEERYSLWDFADEFTPSDDEGYRPIFDDSPQNTKAFMLIACTQKMIKCLNPICGDGSIFSRVWTWLYNDTFGNIDQMRIELESRFNGEQVWIQSYDKKKIDGMLIPGNKYQEEDQNLPTPPNLEGPTVILCNPNAGYYEFSYFQNEWLEYYTNLGLNVFIYNYRDYGRSQGFPSPYRLKKDGERIVQYLRGVRHIRKIGVHGESLGGVVASHIGRYCDIDFVFCDRTFSDLDTMAQKTLFKLASKMLRLFTCWSSDNASDFINIECYKVLANDPADGVVHDLASLKNGISLRLIQSQLRKKQKEKEEDLSSRDRILVSDKDLKELREKTSLPNYYHILTKEETYLLYRNLFDFYEIVTDIGTHRRRHNKRKPNSLNNTGVSHTTEDFELIKSQPKATLHRRGKSGGELNLSQVKGYIDTDLNETEESSKETEMNIRSPRTVGTIISSPKVETELSLKWKKKYKIKEEESDIDSLVELLQKIRKTLESIDAAGMTLNKIFRDKKGRQTELIRAFLINLDLWGSYLPIGTEPYDINQTRLATYVMFSKLISARIHLKKITNAYSKFRGVIFQKVIGNTKVIDFYLGKVEKYLSYKQNQNQAFPFKSGAQDQTESLQNIQPTLQPQRKLKELTIEIEDDKITNDSERELKSGLNTSNPSGAEIQMSIFSEHAPLDNSNGTLSPRTSTSSNEFNPNSIIFSKLNLDSHTLGNYIPLTCGHNGNYNYAQKCIYEFHLLNANMLEQYLDDDQNPPQSPQNFHSPMLFNPEGQYPQQNYQDFQNYPNYQYYQDDQYQGQDENVALEYSIRHQYQDPEQYIREDTKEDEPVEYQEDDQDLEQNSDDLEEEEYEQHSSNSVNYIQDESQEDSNEEEVVDSKNSNVDEDENENEDKESSNEEYVPQEEEEVEQPEEGEEI